MSIQMLTSQKNSQLHTMNDAGGALHCAHMHMLVGPRGDGRKPLHPGTITTAQYTQSHRSSAKGSCHG
jgi:hypothetical protein